MKIGRISHHIDNLKRSGLLTGNPIGLIEFTTIKSSRSPISRTIRSASSKLPSIATIFAPQAKACSNLPLAIFPAGKTTTHEIPARDAYAAAEAEVFPVEAQMIAFALPSIALETAKVMPRSLKEQVGLMPSFFTKTSQPRPIRLLSREE